MKLHGLLILNGKKVHETIYSVELQRHIVVNSRGDEERKCDTLGRFFICTHTRDLATNDM